MRGTAETPQPSTRPGGGSSGDAGPPMICRGPAPGWTLAPAGTGCDYARAVPSTPRALWVTLAGIDSIAAIWLPPRMPKFRLVVAPAAVVPCAVRVVAASLPAALAPTALWWCALAWCLVETRLVTGAAVSPTALAAVSLARPVAVPLARPVAVSLAAPVPAPVPVLVPVKGT